MLFLWNVFYSIFYTNISAQLASLAGFIGFIYCIYIIISKKKRRSLYEGMCIFVMPFIIVTLLSGISSVVVWDTLISDPNVTQSVWRCIYIFSAFMIAYFSVAYFEEKSIFLITIAGIISYSTVVVQKLLNVPNVSLESHGFIESCGLIFIYLVLSENIDNKRKIKFLIPIVLVILLGGKRVVYLALLMTLLIYYLFHRIKSRHALLIKCVLFLYFCIVLVYLWLIKTGYFEIILDNFGIADNSRLMFWSFFSDSYSLSPLYFGRGLQYTDNVMALSSTKDALHLGNNYGIHNDLLRTYIGWGCIPFLAYFYNFFMNNTKKYLKIGNKKNAWKYFSLASYCFFNYLVDYMITDIAFNICFFTIGLLFLREKSIKKAN